MHVAPPSFVVADGALELPSVWHFFLGGQLAPPGHIRSLLYGLNFNDAPGDPGVPHRWIVDRPLQLSKHYGSVTTIVFAAGADEEVRGTLAPLIPVRFVEHHSCGLGA